MPEKNKFRLPIHLKVLNAIGAILLALGILDWKGGSDIIPQSLQFNNYVFTLSVVGILLMLSLMLSVINKKLGILPRDI